MCFNVVANPRYLLMCLLDFAGRQCTAPRHLGSLGQDTRATAVRAELVASTPGFGQAQAPGPLFPRSSFFHRSVGGARALPTYLPSLQSLLSPKRIVDIFHTRCCLDAILFSEPGSLTGLSCGKAVLPPGSRIRRHWCRATNRMYFVAFGFCSAHSLVGPVGPCRCICKFGTLAAVCDHPRDSADMELFLFIARKIRKRAWSGYDRVCCYSVASVAGDLRTPIGTKTSMNACFFCPLVHVSKWLRCPERRTYLLGMYPGMCSKHLIFIHGNPDPAEESLLLPNRHERPSFFCPGENALLASILIEQ